MNRLLALRQQLVSQKTSTFFESNKQSSTIDQTELKKIVYGPNFHERDRALSIVKENSNILKHLHLTEATLEEQREMTSRQFMLMKKYLNKQVLQTKNNPNQFSLFGNGFTFFDLNLTTKMGVHYSLYLKTIERLGTTQLHNHYYERACKFEDFGCMALTELMHGSNVRGIMTEAHYDHQTKQLVIHTPSKDALKYWIGGSGKTSNICVVWSQLYVKGKCQGVHAIIVPLRDKSTHKVLPGILIGDCGHKFGLNGIDNGFIEFTRFRVPVGNLLNKVSGVNQNGDFVSTTDNENKRFGMTLAALAEGRFFMCCHSTTLALSALAIAIRYTFTRKQFSAKPAEKQSFLIDYPLTRRRMIPLLATQVVYMTVTMNSFYTAQNNSDKNNLSPNNPLLKQVHAIASVLKSKTAWAATETIRQCRQMMGGHGYSGYSKMAALYGNNDVNNTWEGENNVLIQQTTKYSLQNYQKAVEGKEVKSPLLHFFNSPPEQDVFKVTAETIRDFAAIKEHLRANIYFKTQELALKMLEMKNQQIPFLDIWNSTQVYLGQIIALQTGDLYILELCLQKLKQIRDKHTQLVFQNILHLWLLTTLKTDESINQQHHALIEIAISEYSDLLVPEILGILECIVAGEEVLGSPFANQNGEGFKKYMNLILSQPRKTRADYWEMIASK